MQKIFSTRLDEATLNEMERVTRKLGMSKRQFLEEAIQLRVERLSRDRFVQVAYLFGSGVRQRLRFDSDLDIGVASSLGPDELLPEPRGVGVLGHGGAPG